MRLRRRLSEEGGALLVFLLRRRESGVSIKLSCMIYALSRCWTFGHPIVRIRTMMDVLIRKSYNASRELEMLWELGQDM